MACGGVIMEKAMEVLLTVWSLINFFTTFGIALARDMNFSFVNPAVIYEYLDVNWFGAILIAVVLNALFPPISILYWLYKLCTVGRK